MKTFLQFLEAFHVSYGGEEVFVNPTRKEVQSATYNRGGEKSSKALLHGDKAYVWAGDNLIHHSMAKRLGIDQSADLHGIYLHHHNKTIEKSFDIDHGAKSNKAIQNHPWIKRQYPTYKLQHPGYISSWRSQSKSSRTSPRA